ncbi:hypothetical protein [Nannocystis bainbridge]|uniref:YecA family protein n=1 Tax=Nannocystis bainbridge TaxID=2995303 RepID=A0ABT5E6W6_9BACT|nr:hypothetical protein [Nannocystis bainbridge]MDC0721168.1 hypothetical protein [Nannocystis bainbridge]
MTDDTASNLLADLLAHLERDGEVPPAWLALHIPDGSLTRAWHATADVLTLVLAAMRAHGTTATVLAICAVARAELARISPSLVGARLAGALEAAESLVRGTGPRDAVDEAFGCLHPQELWWSHDPSPSDEAERVQAFGLGVGLLVWFVLDVEAGEVTPAEAATSLDESDHDSYFLETAQELLPSLRAALPCPTLARLRAAYEHD